MRFYTRFTLGILLSLFCCHLMAAAPSFPLLTGRVVDDAHLLTPQTIANLEKELQDYEASTTNQVVVVTLPGLDGYPIEEYGYQLGRYWQIGQKDKNNGVLLIVAPKEKKVRIEVGYGLEPILTDALSSTIIQDVIIPPFKKGDYQKGIVEGTKAILDVLGGKIKNPQAFKSKNKSINWLEWLFILVIILLFVRNPGLAFLIFSGSGQRFGGSSRGGFSGGGGSFGGGGSSGSW
ncbi:Domain of uncharacterised function (DUF477) (plasmid) [Legionella adelaidensis]|uniref:Domain of uncharacterized function (DUF477) n=1 Tax=Legionella adelaidensis TaxID=45056 RepID=A0A0W0R0C3_9GAMM|nr:TPM domain-containing protein [Legionella adelaidensis]KTC64543.1 hypothetical protein Lade_1837 [Legionella adelaidensis]VEH85910.1 Domain of uncharacterised function (DUF477) [Legionella adelaidensis]